MLLEIKRTLIENVAWDSDLDLENIRDSYSGRYMYGKSCLGIVVDDINKAFRFVSYMTDIDPDIGFELADKAKLDSMGLSTIVYFPGVTVVE